MSRRRTKAQVTADKLFKENTINEAEDLRVRMEFLEKQLAEATKES